MKRSAIITLLVGGLALMLACQEDTGALSASVDASTAADIGPEVDSTQQTADSGPSEEADTAPDAGSDTLLLDGADASDSGCTITGFTPGQQVAFIGAQTYAEPGQGHWNLTAISADGGSRLVVENGLSEGGPAAPGMYPLLMESDSSDIEVSLHTGCGEDGCDTVYVPLAGTLEIESLVLSSGGDVRLSLSDALFIAGDPQDDGTVADASTWCVDGSYEATFHVQGGPGEALPEFVLLDQAGAEVSNSSLQGTMAVILINFNDWCPPCVSTAKASEALWNEYAIADDRFDVSYTQLLYDNPAGDPSDQDNAVDWATEHAVTYPVLHGQGVQDLVEVVLGDEFDVSMTASTAGVGFPAYWIVDPLGQIREFNMGFQDGAPNFSTEQLVAQFDAFLTEHPDWAK
jgi:thiol-disulfide isomerase/thioredoxin